MSEEYGDTSIDSTEDSQTSGSESYDSTQDTGDIGSGSEGEGIGPVPYERFKESRDQLSESNQRIQHLENQLSSMQQKYYEQAEWNRQAWDQIQNQSAPEPEEDIFADPLEKEVNYLKAQLEQQQQIHDRRYHEMQVEQAERQILSELNAARKSYPEMRDSDVMNQLMQNPNASISALAKRSHEQERSRFEQRLKRGGYKAPPQPLTRSRGNVVSAKDFGDDLGAAEAAAIARLSGE